MARTPVILFILLLLHLQLFGQKPILVNESNRQELFRIAREQDSIREIQMSLAESYFRDHGGARKKTNGVLVGVWPTGRPKYIIEHNRSAGAASQVDQLYLGGNLAQTLTGKGMTVGVWEIGSPLNNHVEYAGRISFQDEGNEVRNHATHVTGTIVASGINSEARGMAYEASANVYSAAGYLTEIATAAAEGLLVSNHSYGASAGYNRDGEWLGDPEISTVEDWKFGIYNPEASTLDEIAYNAPYYLLVRSAGNERGESGSGGFPPDGPYDCMTGEAIAKNILSVGNAINLVSIPENPEDIQLRSSSSWGPTDDGRIKPDLVAVGTNLLSSSSESTDAYTELSGTSMSSPVVAGSALLLQQQYQRQYGSFMRSATIKGILLHTTLEAGLEDGPDYSYGYGFLNAEFASRVIDENGANTYIKENMLSDGENYSFEYEVTDDNTPLIVSLSWTDPEGIAITQAVLDPTDLKLVNDLDIRIIGPDDQMYFPWILDPANPASKATKGDNFRDNYEKIEIVSPTPGTYTIIVSHKETMTNGEQAFSVIASAINQEDTRNTFYWVGGSGSWDDGSHWSLISGGAPSGMVPTNTDRVIFDTNGLSSNQTVSLTTNASVYQLTWLPENGSRISFGDHKIQVAKAANFSASIGNTPGKIEFTLSNSGFHSLHMQQANPELSIELNQSNSNLFLSGDDLRFKDLILKDGNVELGNDITVRRIDLSDSESGQVVMQNIHINTEVFATGNPSENEINLGNSVLNFIGTNNRLDVDGPISLNEVNVLSGTLAINKNIDINELTLAASTSLDIADGQQLNIGHLEILANQTERVRLTSNGEAVIANNVGIKLCFDFIDIENVSVAGNTKFVYENNSTLSGATGWINAACEDVLFARYSFESPCAGATTFFFDESDGNPSTWLWDFGDGNTSNEQNPSHVYTQAGSYEISLEVIENDETSTITGFVGVIPSNLETPIIEEQSGRLLTNSTGQFFQWYLNGTPIEGETNRLLGIEPGDGIYQVEVRFEECLALSQPYTITGLFSSIGNRPVLIYPNPNEGSLLNIELPISFQTGQLLIFDFTGTMVFEKQLRYYGSRTITTKLPKTLAAGIYVVRLLDAKSNQEFNSKFLVQ